MSTIFKKKRLFLFIFLMLLIPLVIAGCDNNNDNGEVEEDVEVAQESLLIDDLTYTNLYSADIGLDIYWEFNDDEDQLHMMLEGPVTGWLAIGFDATTRMNDARIIISGFDGDDYLLEEHIGTSGTSHEQIDETYITESTGERNDDSTISEFIIPLDEDSRYALEAGETQAVIIGFHDDDDNFMQRHTQRATVEIDF